MVQHRNGEGEALLHCKLFLYIKKCLYNLEIKLVETNPKLILVYILILSLLKKKLKQEQKEHLLVSSLPFDISAWLSSYIIVIVSYM